MSPENHSSRSNCFGEDHQPTEVAYETTTSNMKTSMRSMLLHPSTSCKGGANGRPRWSSSRPRAPQHLRIPCCADPCRTSWPPRWANMPLRQRARPCAAAHARALVARGRAVDANAFFPGGSQPSGAQAEPATSQVSSTSLFTYARWPLRPAPPTSAQVTTTPTTHHRTRTRGQGRLLRHFSKWQGWRPRRGSSSRLNFRSVRSKVAREWSLERPPRACGVAGPVPY